MPMNEMKMRLLLLIATCTLLGNSLQGESIAGTVRIERKLTKRSVTAEVSIYQRGPATELGKDSEGDPLAFERSRVVVWIEGPEPAGRSASSPGRAVMEQAGRRFLPDLVVIPVGGVVSFPNSDPIFHNVFSLSKPQTFDLGNYPKGDTRTVTFKNPGIVYVNCHLHTNMAGAIVVTPNAWNAKADRAGRFELRDVPPGDYTVVAWHKAAGYFRKQIRIARGSNGEIEFFIPIEEIPAAKLGPGR
jgi:plastocyanin